MPAIPNFGPDAPPALFFLGGLPGIALIAIYAIGVVPGRYATATVGNVPLGQKHWPAGGLIRRNLVKVEHNILYPNVDLPFYAELQALVDVIVTRHPVRLQFKTDLGRHDVNSRRSAQAFRADYEAAELFGGRIGSFIPIFLAVAEVATANAIAAVLTTPPYVVRRHLRRFEQIGATFVIKKDHAEHWALNPGFFAYRELYALLHVLAKRYRPEFYAAVVRSRQHDPSVRVMIENLREAGILPVHTDSQSEKYDKLSK